MKNPFRDMSRPKALATAGIVAGVVAISGAAAAVNVGLLTGNDSAPFEPQKVSASADGMVTTTTPPVEVIVKDVYEQAPPPPAPVAPAPAPAPVSGSHDSDDDGYDDSYEDDSYEDDSYEDDDHESEDQESEDHEEEDDSYDD